MHAPVRYEEVETANDRMKKSFGEKLWGSIILAVILHFLVLAFFPALHAEDWRTERPDISVVDVPPDIVIPPPPEAIQRPATPIISEVDVDIEITIPNTHFDDNPAQGHIPPPTDEGVDLSVPGAFVVHTVSPGIVNADEVRRALLQGYPSALREAGIGGTVLVHMFVAADGSVSQVALHESSGHSMLDSAALRIARETPRFRPAMNRDEPVGVWVSVPFRFTTGR